MPDRPPQETQTSSRQETSVNLTIENIQNLPAEVAAWLWQNFLKRLDSGAQRKSALVLLQKEFNEYLTDPEAKNKPIPLLTNDTSEIAASAQELQDYISTPEYKMANSKIANKYFPELSNKIDDIHKEFVNFDTKFDQYVVKLAKTLFDKKLETLAQETSNQEELLELRRTLQGIRNDSMQLFYPFPNLRDKINFLEKLSERAEKLHVLVGEFQKKINI